jgi:hypothetical protein
MKKWIFVLLVITQLTAGLNQPARAQCSICTRSAQQLGERPAKALNAGILYLAFAPLAIAGFIGYRWVKQNQGS